jgi:stearoyl-CoA desaturase (Delta-9 desaturase)
MEAAVIERKIAKPIPGRIRLSQRELRAHRIGLILVSVIPLAGVGIAIWQLWGSGLSGTDAAIFGGLYAFTGLGITSGFHRLFAHKGYEAKAPARIVLAVAGSMAIEMGVIGWVATHRRHHAFSDQPGDPHSPHLQAEQGFKGIIKGLWYAHMGWLLSDDRTAPERWAPDLLKDKPIRAIDRQFPFWVAVSFVLPAVLGLAITQSFIGMLTAFVWGGLVRIFLLHHVTFSINSVCHFFGTRPYATKEKSTNNWLLAIASFGESWHNNHHAFPSSAIFGRRFWQVDLGGILIRTLQFTGLARKVRKDPEPVAA